jgi:hypothetical protein
MRKKLAEKQGPKKICLTMIVKNESKNMPRLLESVHTIIDMISIVDTGSTDNTIKVIYDLGVQYKKPTKVHQEPFKNFAYNRTHSVLMARAAYPEADYYLLSDADFKWEISDNFNRTQLMDHVYMVEQYNGQIRYWNIRLLSALVDWECVGVTHEYWEANRTKNRYNSTIRNSRLETLVINDLEDGGAKNDKFIRDERLLREGLGDKKTPRDVKSRYKFYLAETLNNIGKYEESIDWYTKRISDGGFAEEVYIANHKIGNSHERLGDRLKHLIECMEHEVLSDDDFQYIKQYNPDGRRIYEIKDDMQKYYTLAGTWYLKGYNYRKTRAESLYDYVKLMRIMGNHSEAYEYAHIGKQIKYPEGDKLFVNPTCYDYLFDYEISIIAFYIEGARKEGHDTTEYLLGRSDIPDWMRDMVQTNAVHYK